MPLTRRTRIGVGGLGRVYLVCTPGGRPFAVKVVRSDYAHDPEFRRRFKREIKAARSVEGLYTAPVVDADGEARLPWPATAYVPGPYRLIAGVAEGLTVVHASGNGAPRPQTGERAARRRRPPGHRLRYRPRRERDFRDYHRPSDRYTGLHGPGTGTWPLGRPPADVFALGNLAGVHGDRPGGVR